MQGQPFKTIKMHQILLHINILSCLARWRIHGEFPQSFSAGFRALSHVGRLSFITPELCAGMMDETLSCTHKGSSYFCPVFLGHPRQNSTSIGDFVKDAVHVTRCYVRGD